MKNPWLKFYPADWRADPALRMCSLAARGLWMEMLCLMHDAEPQGSLVVNGRPVTDKQLAALSGSTIAGVASALGELEEAGVFSRDEDGTLYSRRMRRDIAKAERDRENGRGGGNPALKRGVNPRPNGGHKAQKQKPEADAEADIAAGAAICGAGVSEASSDAELRGWLGPIVEERPLAVDPDMTPIRLVLEEPAIIPADVETGAREACIRSRKPLRSWASLVPWIRRAASDRLAAAQPRGSPGEGSPPSRGPRLSHFAALEIADPFEVQP